MTARPLSDDLYVLRFLAGQTLTDDAQACEYRLTCSGFLSGNVPRGGGNARVLMAKPFEWVVASEVWRKVPTDEWPQETMVRFQVMPIDRIVGNAHHSYYPDDELAHALAALLSLLTRRLISVAGCVSYRTVDKGPDRPILELPLPLFTRLQLRHWQLQPHVVLRRAQESEARAVDYNPEPKTVDRDAYASLLSALPQLKAARSLVLAARLYSQALALVHQEPDMAYLLVTMAIECVASQAVDGTKTDDEIGKGISSEFRSFMQTLGANESQTRKAIVMAIPQHGRPTYQFRAFAEEFCTEELFGEDDLFRIGTFAHLLPTKDTLKRAAISVYEQRSKFVHEGKPYPATIALGLAPKVDTRAFQIDDEKGLPIPPFAWAERLAHVSIVNYWRKESQTIGSTMDAPR